MRFNFWMLASVVFLFGLFVPSAPSAAVSFGKDVLTGAHGNERLLPKSCRACHKGMQMVVSGEEDACLGCHGGAIDQAEMTRQGYLSSDAKLADIKAEMKKPYSHPVMSIEGVHHRLERLPEDQVNAARHVECNDCHNAHEVDKGAPFQGLTGKRVGNFIADIEHEYELCYRCHSDSANLPINSTNKHAEFKSTNRSFHPVEAEGRNLYVISLKEPYVAKKELPGDISTITCSDCHGSDDAGGPQGPHGSNYQGLLVDHYSMEDGLGESAFAYELCYRCHDRISILGNESFPYHAQHIEGDRSRNLPGTSCYTCHDAHGSTQYQFLIRFNEDIVEPASSGKLEYKAQGVASRHGSCTLMCHDINHDQLEY